MKTTVLSLIILLFVVLLSSFHASPERSSYYVVYMSSQNGKIFAYSSVMRHNCGYAVSDQIITSQFRKHMHTRYKKFTSGMLDIYFAVQHDTYKTVKDRLDIKLRQAHASKREVVNIRSFRFSCQAGKNAIRGHERHRRKQQN